LGLKTIGGRFGGLGLKTIGGRFHRFGPQNLGAVPTRNGWRVAASVSSRWSEATGEKARWPSDQIIPIRTKLSLEIFLFGSCI
jgi:hypothetical protein